MIGSCDCCDRQHVPVSRFEATGAYPEGVACYICQGDAYADPYGELEDSQNVPRNENGKNLPENGKDFPLRCTMCGGTTKHRGGCINDFSHPSAQERAKS